jgi:hypothetical protein
MTEEETKAYIDEAAKKAILNYKTADSWWQKYRREHPIAVQNILGFGGLFVGGLIGYFVR